LDAVGTGDGWIRDLDLIRRAVCADQRCGDVIDASMFVRAAASFGRPAASFGWRLDGRAAGSGTWISSGAACAD
jgi:hypothetical protein